MGLGFMGLEGLGKQISRGSKDSIGHAFACEGASYTMLRDLYQSDGCSRARPFALLGTPFLVYT